ncbi:hypothetical protein R1flu_001079 [Riccia fluitans]|uniref:SET domain-containing protein n=1 Tax=Riccia fluitans TaxID=41844 RepID=A0ABD1Y393_9MARC
MQLGKCFSAFQTKASLTPPIGSPANWETDNKGERNGNARDDRKVERLRSWLRKQGHHDCNLRLERWPRASDAPGYGMVAGDGGINKSDVIVRVSREAFMSEETAANCPYVGPIADVAQLSPWQAMCLHLLCERARGEKSPWYPYIALLPSELQMAGAHPMLWPQRMRRDWLAGSPMLDTTERRLQICREDHGAMLAAGASSLMPAGPGSGGFVTESSVRWAAVILLSRSFSLDLDEAVQRDTGPSIALVPWADMLNHSSAAGKESCLVYDIQTKTASLRAHRSYNEGEQVYDSYGPNLSPSQLLLDYGFVDEENRNYAVDLPVQYLGPLKSKRNAVLMATVGLPYGGTIFTLTPDGVDENILAWTRAAVASHKELSEAGWKEDTATSMWQHHVASSAMAHFSRAISRENEGEVLRRILWACEDLLNRYPTSLDEDVAALTANDAGGTKVVPLPWAKQQAVRALVSEKRALIGARQHLWEALKKLRSGVPVHQLYG